MLRRDKRNQLYSLFDGKPGIVRHYVAVERDYLTPVLGERALGRVSVYADAIPWKWNRDSKPPLKNQLIGLEARQRVGCIASVRQPHLVVALGQEVANQLGTPLPATSPKTTSASLADWAGSWIALWHPNHHWASGDKAVYLVEAQASMREVLVAK